MEIEAAFAAAALAESGGAGTVAAADPRTVSQQELDHMDSLEIENSGEIELNGIMAAVDYMSEHWGRLTSCAADASELVLTGSRGDDDRLYREFRAAFGGLDVAVVREGTLKEPRSQEAWRTFMMAQDGRLEEFNMICLLRIDAALGYDNDNTLLVPRVQFLAIEIARNREGVNDVAQLKDLLLCGQLVERKAEIKVALVADDWATAAAKLRDLASEYPIVPRRVLQQTGMAKFLHNQLAKSTDEVVAATARSLERQWKSGVVMSRLSADRRADVACAAQYVVERWQGLGAAATGGGFDGAAAAGKGGPVEQARLQLMVSEEERAAQTLQESTIEAAAAQFERDGVLYVESALHPELLGHARAAVDGCCDFLGERLEDLGHSYAGDAFAFGNNPCRKFATDSREYRAEWLTFVSVCGCAAEVQYRDGARLDSRFLIEQTVCGSELIAQHPLWYPVVQRLLGDAQLLFGKFQHARLLCARF